MWSSSSNISVILCNLFPKVAKNVAQAVVTLVEGSIPQWKDKLKPVAITSSATKRSNSVDTGHTNWRSDSLKVPLPSNKSIATQESHIWLQYHVIHEGWKAQLVKVAHAHMKEMMEMMHSSPEDYTKLYLCALSSLAEEYAEWKALSQPSTHIKSPSSSPQPCKAKETCKVKEGVSPPPKIETNVHERETPSHQDIMSLTTHGYNSVLI